MTGIKEKTGHVQEVIDWLRHTLEIAEENFCHFDRLELSSMADVYKGRVKAPREVLVRLEKLSEMLK